MRDDRREIQTPYPSTLGSPCWPVRSRLLIAANSPPFNTLRMFFTISWRT